MFLCSFVFELVLCCFHPIKGDLWVNSFSKILQAIDTIVSLFENHIPMRFGVILYSAKLIEEIESSGGELPLSYREKDSPSQEDLSSLVTTRIFS